MHLYIVSNRVQRLSDRFKPVIQNDLTRGVGAR